jgi:DNA-binding GntR family transcriptional regulator
MIAKKTKDQSLTATEFAYKSIRQTILSGKFKVGQNLNYAQLEKMLGISKTPIIRALARLEPEGFVRYLKNRGYSVSDNGWKTISQNMETNEVSKVVDRSGNNDDDILNETKFLPPSLNAIIYEKIKAMILDMKVQPGQKLAYCDLENKFGVSKTPIINALSKLESEGYIYAKKNVGCFVKDVNPEEISEVMEARVCLEVSNIDLVMKHFNQAEFRELEKLHKKYCAYKTEIFDRRKNSANSKFHIQLAKMGQNRFIIKYIQHIYEWLEIRVRMDVFPTERIKQAEFQHSEILEALRRRDGDVVKSLLTHHLKGTIKYHKENTLKSNQIPMNLEIKAEDDALDFNTF